MRLHSRIDGPDGAPVVLLAGSLGTELTMWDDQLALADRFRLVRFDHRGHGGSPVPPGPYEIADLGGDVLGLMDELAITKASFCGASLGGMAGMWLAANAPERIDRLVLICTSAHVPPPSPYPQRAALVRQAGTCEAVADEVLGRWFTPDFFARKPELVARYRAMIVSTPPEGYAGCCDAIGALDLRAELPAVRARTLVIAAAADTAIPPDHGRAIAAAIPDAGLSVLEGAAHLASVERADAVTQLISEHLSPGGWA